MDEENDSLVAGIFDGLYQMYAPQAYAYSKKKALADYERNLMQTDIGKTIQLSQEAVDAETDPIRKAQKQNIQSYARMLTPTTAVSAGDALSNMYTNISKGDMPTDLAKNAGFLYNSNIPEQVREAARQKWMNDRPYDNRTLDIKQQNADISAANVKNKAALGGVGGVGGAGKVNLNKDQYLNPDGTVSAYEGSIADKKQVEDYTNDAKETASKLQLYSNVENTIDTLLDDEGLKSQFGKGDIVSGGLAHLIQFLSPDTRATLGQLNEQLKTLGGAEYKAVAGSPGSMQYKEWEIFQKQLAALSDPNISLKKAKEALGFVKSYLSDKRDIAISIHENQYRKVRGYNPEIVDKFKKIDASLPDDLSALLRVKRGMYKMSPDGGLRQNIATGDLEINENGKWVKATVESSDGKGFSLKTDEYGKDTKPSNDLNIDDLVNQYKSK